MSCRCMIVYTCTFRKRFTESENQVVLRRVITETKALDDTIALSQIRGMLYMYVYTLSSYDF